MEVGNIKKTATFKSFPHINYKNTQLLIFVTAFQYFHETNINRSFLGVTQKYELRLSFNLSDQAVFTTLTKSHDKNLNILRTKRAFKMK